MGCWLDCGGLKSGDGDGLRWGGEVVGCGRFTGRVVLEGGVFGIGSVKVLACCGGWGGGWFFMHIVGVVFVWWGFWWGSIYSNGCV